jgi:hypothetical protein
MKYVFLLSMKFSFVPGISDAGAALTFVPEGLRSGLVCVKLGKLLGYDDGHITWHNT